MFLTGNEFFERRRAQFPFFERKICLQHAGISPLPARVSSAVQNFAARCALEGQADEFAFPTYNRCKERLANLVGNGAKSEEIAFAGSTSHALGLVATSLDWKKGENCVVCAGDFPANVIIWKNLAPTRGVDVRIVPFKAKMNIGIKDLAPFVDEKTRIVSLSAVNFLTGTVLDLKTIGKWLHQRGVLLCVDGIQALGSLDLDWSEADFLCADAHKWLLGPNGIAFLWTRPQVLKTLRPQILGWLAVQNRDDWFSYDTTPFPTAERFEPGARNYLGIAGLDASLEILEETGIAQISARVTTLRNFAAQKLGEIGCPLLASPEPTQTGAILTFQAPRGETLALHAALEVRYATSLRKGYDGQNWIRIAPHFMNCEDDLSELAQMTRGF